MAHVTTVGELKKDLEKYDDSLPIYFNTVYQHDMIIYSAYDTPKKIVIDIGENDEGVRK